MKLIGIVAEYNPFHNGHKYHIEESRKAFDEETAVVCVMSGDFVQRGEAAVFSKYARAEAAVKGGADLVLELPLPWSLASAEGFARGGVGLLSSLGCIDRISFGSECGDLATLNALAMALIDPEVMPAVTEEMKSGISFAAARQLVMERQLGDMAKHLAAPNNILAVEYIKAIFMQHSRLEPMTILRQGAGHDQEGGSASDLRVLLQSGKSIRGLTPKKCKAVFDREKKAGRGPVSMKSLEIPIISRLRMMDGTYFDNLPDAGEGLGKRLCAAAHDEPSLEGIISAAKTKRYALSRIRRMTMCAALGVTAEYTDSLPPYARILAANSRGQKALKIIAEKSSIPIITKPATIRECSQECKDVFLLGSGAHDLLVMAYKAYDDRRGEADYRTSPVMVQKP